MDTLIGKKLLVLGGSAYMVDPVLKAKSMGVYTIVTDWHEIEKSPAKQVADEYWTISLMDYDQLVPKIKENKIDGILTGFTDNFLLAYQHLCELADLPCYATKEQLEWSLDKRLFKNKCREYNVPVVPEYDIQCFDKTIIGPEHKVIIKPVDSSGSQGIYICEDPNEFEEKLKCSLEYSAKKQVVIERYMDCDDVSFEYKIQDGEITLTAICDRYIYKTPNEGSITSKLIYPSKYTDAYLADVDKRVRKMFEAEGLRNGVLFMQAFAESGQFYFYEMGYRLSGGRHYIFTKNQNGESALEELICFATTGKMSDKRISDIANPRFKEICSQLSIICQSDKIAKIDGFREVTEMHQVIDAIKMFKEGDMVGKQGTTSSIFAKLHIVVKDVEELDGLIKRIYSILKVENEKGENLIINSI